MAYPPVRMVRYFLPRGRTFPLSAAAEESVAAASLVLQVDTPHLHALLLLQFQ